MNIEEFKLFGEVIEVVSYLAIILGVVSFWSFRKQLNFDVMTNCMSRFQNLLEKGIKNNTKEYADLCNEQLFYIQHKYLKKEISLEWLDGMADCLPHFMKHESDRNVNISKQCVFKYGNENIVLGYDRIVKTFTFDKSEYKDLMRKDHESFDIKRTNRKKFLKVVYKQILDYKF